MNCTDTNIAIEFLVVYYTICLRLMKGLPVVTSVETFCTNCLGTLHEIVGGIGGGSGVVEPIILAPASTRPSLGARLSALLGSSPSASAFSTGSHARLLHDPSRTPSSAAFGGGSFGAGAAGHSSSARASGTSTSLLASFLDPRGESPPPSSAPTSGSTPAPAAAAVAALGPAAPAELFVVLERLYPLLDAITQMFHVGGHKQLQFVSSNFNL